MTKHDPRKPWEYPERILVIVCGQTPQIITETVHGLVTDNPAFVPTKIVVVTTSVGRKHVVEKLIDKNGPQQFNKMLTDLKKRLQHKNLTESVTEDLLSQVKLENLIIKVPADKDGNEDEDSHTPESLTRMGDLILSTLIENAGDNSAINLSLAGGRKSMSYLAGLALSLMARAQDHLSHVIVSHRDLESSEHFYFPRFNQSTYSIDVIDPNTKKIETRNITAKDVSVKLLDVPFLRTRELLGKHQFLMDGTTKSLSQLVSDANAVLRHYGEKKLRFVLSAKKVFCNDKEVTIKGPVNYFHYYAIAAFKVNEEKPLINKPELEDVEKYLNYVTRDRKGSKGKKNNSDRGLLIEDSLTGDYFIDPNIGRTFTNRRTLVNNALTEAFGGGFNAFHIQSRSQKENVEGQNKKEKYAEYYLNDDIDITFE